jgi:hypothetical protein
MKTWALIKDGDVRHTKQDETLYCNVILPEHQQIVDGLQGVITIEDRPTE